MSAVTGMSTIAVIMKTLEFLVQVSFVTLLVITIYCLKLDHVPDEYPLRLVGGSTPAQGRLEVFYNGQWGSVCDDYFGGVEARVSALYM